MTGSQQGRNAVDKLIDAVSLVLLAIGTAAGCWLFWSMPGEASSPWNYADVIMRATTAITFSFTISGLVVMPLREGVQSLCGRTNGWTVGKQAQRREEKRLRQLWSRAAAHL
jgi:hypothetical protein